MKIYFISVVLVLVSFGSFSQSVEKEVKIKFTVPVIENFSFGNWALAPDGKSFQVLFYKTLPGYLNYPSGVGSVVDRTGLMSLGGISFYQVSDQLEVLTVVNGLVKSEANPHKNYKAFVQPNLLVGSNETDLSIDEWRKKLKWDSGLVPLNIYGDRYSVKQPSTESGDQPYNNPFANQLGQFEAIGDFGRRFSVSKGNQENYWDENYNLPALRTNWETSESVTFDKSSLGGMTYLSQVEDPLRKQIQFVWDIALTGNKDMGKLFKNIEFRIWSERNLSKPSLNLIFDHARSMQNIGLVPDGKGYYSIWKKRPFMAAKYSDPERTGHNFVWIDTNNRLLTNTHFVFPFKDPEANVIYSYFLDEKMNFIFDGTEKLTSIYGIHSFDNQGKYTSAVISKDSIKMHLSPSSLPFWNDIRGNTHRFESHLMLKDGTVLFTLNGTSNTWETVKKTDGTTEVKIIKFYNGTLFLHTTSNYQIIQSYFIPKSDKKVGFSNAHLVKIVEEKDSKLKIIILEPRLSKSKREIASESFPRVWSEGIGESKPSNAGDILMRPKFVLLDLGAKDIQVKESDNQNFYLENGGQVKVNDGNIYLLGREAGKNDLQISQTEPLEINYVLQKLKW